jgi:uncharacterized protein (DUF2267 family)
MPMPYTYRHASAEFRAFLDDARDTMNLTSDNATYTAVDAVFQVFRARLTVPQALAFADELPCVLRAIFLWRWHPETPLPFPDRAALVAEALAIRPHHNQTPANCIDAVARALRKQVLAIDLDRVLAQLPPGAQAFWHVPGDSPRVTFP